MRLRLALTLAAALFISALAGCYRTANSVRHVTAADLKIKHPACFQQPGTGIPKAFIVKNDAALKQLWGPGEDPPVVNFQNNMVLVAFDSLTSDGPGTLEIWVQKYEEGEDVLNVQVREDVAGAWPVSTSFARAYDIVEIPHSSKPIKIQWHYTWGTRDETREVRADEWVPTESTTNGAGGGQSTWSGIVQPGRTNGQSTPQ